MKKAIQFSCLLAAFMLLGVNAQAQKFGYVNTAAILAEMPEVKQAEAELESYQKQLQKKGQSMLQQLQQDYTSVQEKVQKGELSPRQQEEEAARLQEEEQKIGAYEKEMMQKIQEKRNSVLKPIYDRVNEAIAAVAKEQGYQFIFDQAVLLYYDDKTDVSEAVKVKLGM